MANLTTILKVQQTEDVAVAVVSSRGADQKMWNIIIGNATHSARSLVSDDLSPGQRVVVNRSGSRIYIVDVLNYANPNQKKVIING
ncbi:MAG: hypothetical protein SWH61_03255 [Thermodesulfobacteriota bacterium]|nr:hypothetical protein [Thermodesulfobacteriota bacterium]